MKKRFIYVLLSMLLLAGCSSVYKDGQYEGKSTPDEKGEYSVVKITLKNNVITDCEFKTLKSDGEEKDEEYAASAKEAAIAVESVPEYEKQLVEKGDISQVDAISGATENYNQLNEAVYDALSKAN